ncbi:MAG: hypothetical protein ACKVPX_10635 [Myxococcaceae bacterium]
MRYDAQEASLKVRAHCVRTWGSLALLGIFALAPAAQAEESTAASDVAGASAQANSDAAKAPDTATTSSAATSDALTTSDAPHAAKTTGAAISDASTTSDAPTPAPDRQPWFGVGFDVGVPDGIGVQGYFRPIKFVRLHVGPLYNIAAFGIRGGVSIIPFEFVLTPTLTAEFGHYFPGDIGRIVRLFGRDVTDPTAQQAFTSLAYTFGNLHLGLEIGSPRSFQFFLRFGLSYIIASLRNAQSILRTAVGDDTLEVDDPVIRLTAPSLKLGFAFYFG